MPNFEMDKWSLSKLHDLHIRGRLDIQPPYQRGRAWSDDMRRALVDTILSDFPMGVILLDEEQISDDEGNKTIEWKTVDGQQRCTTILEYLDGEAEWTRKKGFTRFSELSNARQDAVNDYHVPVAYLRNYSEAAIRDIFIRIQYGRSLLIGEKVKALNSPYQDVLARLSTHKLFKTLSPQNRDGQWALAAAFFKAAYKKAPLERQEYIHIERFLRDEDGYNEVRSRNAGDEVKWLLNYLDRVLRQAISQDSAFKKEVKTQRLLKWMVPALMMLRRTYALQGKEPAVARGLKNYWDAKAIEESDEWEAYLRTGRTGRIDTVDVRMCLEQMMNSIITTADLVPVDAKRFFTPQQRKEILKRSSGNCQICKTELSFSNFHADHITPHSTGGETSIENGQALCSACNRKKGSRSALSDIFIVTDTNSEDS